MAVSDGGELGKSAGWGISGNVLEAYWQLLIGVGSVRCVVVKAGWFLLVIRDGFEVESGTWNASSFSKIQNTKGLALMSAKTYPCGSPVAALWGPVNGAGSPGGQRVSQPTASAQ